MEKKSIMTVMYKGIKVPAKMKEFSNGISKLMPINTNRYTLYGIPKPSNLNIDAAVTAAANTIIRENKKIEPLSDSKRIILAKYARKGSNAVLKGHPVGIVVAFVHDDKLLIGWSKRLEGQEITITPSEKDKIVYTVKSELTKERFIEHCKRYFKENKIAYTVESKSKEPLTFTKKDAMLLAIERGLVDTITFRGSIAYTKEEKIVPRSIVNGLDQFIQRSQRYFKRAAFNVIINEEG